MIWRLSHRFDPPAVRVADRHYSRQKPGTPQFMPAGRALVLHSNVNGQEAVWGTSWQFEEYTDHDWPGAWMCSIFRNETAMPASRMILDAVSATRFHFGDAPERGMVTFVDKHAIQKKGHLGHCFIMAGFRPVGFTKKRGLLVLQLMPDRMPIARPALGMSHRMEFAA